MQLSRRSRGMQHQQTRTLDRRQNQKQNQQQRQDQEEANFSGSALKFIGFEVMSSLSESENSKPRAVKMLVKIVAAHIQTHSSVGTLHLKATNEWQVKVQKRKRDVCVCEKREIMSPLAAATTRSDEDVNDKLKLLKTSHWQGVSTTEEIPESGRK